MTLIDEVRAVCRRLAPQGWADLSRSTAWISPRRTSPKSLPESSQTSAVDFPGFEDFAIEGRRAIEPGCPARSLLFHALASPNVLRGAGNEPLRAFPTLAEIDVVENYVFGAKPPTLQGFGNGSDGAPLAVAVFASEFPDRHAHLP